MTTRNAAPHFRPQLRVLDRARIERIHAATLELLERTGVTVTHPAALDALAGAGARVDGQRVRLPAWLVEESLRRAPSRVQLGNRCGDPGLVLAGGQPWFGPNLDCMDFLPPFGGERRPFRLADCRTTARLLDALPNYPWGMTFGLAADVPPALADRLVLKETLSHCEKPVVFCCRNNASLRDIHDMGVLLAGGESAFREDPSILMLADPISPLVHPGETLEKMIFCAQKGIPQICCGAPQAGSTAPATLAGALVQGNAETLSGLTVIQLLQPGAPVLIGTFATVMDMRTTVFSYGAPEMSLMGAAMAQMARFYDLPVFGTAGCSDAKEPDPQAASEATLSCFSAALCGADLVHDCGLLDHGSLVSPAFMVFMDEALQMVAAYTGGMVVDEDSLALDVIDRVGPGGHFLREDHTYEHFRDIWYSDLFDRSVLEVWRSKGGKAFDARLQAEVRSKLEHQPRPVPEDIAGELDVMAATWR